MDYVIFCDLSMSEGLDQYTIRYEELIAPAIKVITELSDTVDKQEKRIKSLENKILKS